ncbi:nitrogen regulation protein NR(I) [Porticoccaceae bacterium LTM1]|nr:nitrogen regulation protein NR(I) [Porticoccaceae bacterium LTM1]
MTDATVWIVDDDHAIRWVAEKTLARAGLKTVCFSHAEELLEQLSSESPDAILSDIQMPGIDGLQLLQRIHQAYPGLPVIITTAHSDLDSAVSAYEGGAFEYLPKPFDIEELAAVAQRAINFSREHRHDTAAETHDPNSPEIIGEAQAMQEVFRAIGRLAHSHITVLINGESGTGKELVARALHRHSPRRKGEFVALNMAAIPHELIESELFGHEKGAFTGATQQRKGRFEQANGGTLFLDEIGDMPPEAQTRLLRVLAEGEFYRVGGHTAVKVDVRVIAATHQNLEQLVANNQFREDLFHRLNVIRLHLPRLTERKEDIPKLARHFLKKAAIELGIEPKILLPESEQFLCQQPWPGNVRQLENCCRWLTVMAPGREIHKQDLPPELLTPHADVKSAPSDDWKSLLQQSLNQQLAQGKRDLLSEAMPAFEKAAIETALKFTGGKKKEAAELLGWGRNTLTRKLKELGIN